MEVENVMDSNSCLVSPESWLSKRPKRKRKSSDLSEMLETRAIEYFLSEWKKDRARTKNENADKSLSEIYTEKDLKRWARIVIKGGRIKWDEIAKCVINQKQLDFFTDVGILHTEILDKKVFGIFDKIRGSKSSSCLYLVKEKKTTRYYFREKFDALAYMWGFNNITRQDMSLFLQVSQEDATFAPENKKISARGVWGYNWEGNLQNERR